MKVIVDAFGGDNAPLEIVKGCVRAVNADKTLDIVMTGDADVLKPMLAELYSGGAISVLDAKEVIGCDESPTAAVREKKNSSMVVGLNALKEDAEAGAMVSAGSTGALLTGAFMIVRRIKGISRPALSPVLPTLKGGSVILCDCGANADCKPVNLCHFALMASKYARLMFGVESPRVALLSNGTEESKGSEMIKEAHAMLKEMKGINFIGNIEARDLISGDADVVVADGFTGNVVLKGCEGMVNAFMTLLKDGVKKGGLKAKLGALFLKDTLRGVKKKMDYNEVGGAIFLGVEKVVVKAHGSSKETAIANAVAQAKRLAELDITSRIKESLAENDVCEDR